MRVHVVRPDDGWILQRIGDALIRSMKSCVSASTQPRADVDVNFYCNYALMESASGALDVGWFTHLPSDEDDDGWRRDLFWQCVDNADVCVAQSKLTASHLPQDRTLVWHGLPVVTGVKQSLKLGVCARLSRRKRLDRVEALRQIDGVEIVATRGHLGESDMQIFYQSIDYLVVTSDTEGGPIPVLEAIAAGVPVIAPNVGFCWEYPVVRYEDTADLVRVVSILRPQTCSLQAAADALDDVLQQSLALDRRANPVRVAGEEHKTIKRLCFDD